MDRTLEPPGSFSARQSKLNYGNARPVHVAYTSAQMELGEIAAHTGGVFIASTDLDEGMKEAMDLERAGYTLDFYSDDFLSGDELGKVKIKSTRPGVRLSHRRGVTAPILRDHPELGIQGRIAVGTSQESGPDASRSLRIPFQLIVDPGTMGYVQGGGGWRGSRSPSTWSSPTGRTGGCRTPTTWSSTAIPWSSGAPRKSSPWSCRAGSSSRQESSPWSHRSTIRRYRTEGVPKRADERVPGAPARPLGDGSVPRSRAPVKL